MMEVDEVDKFYLKPENDERMNIIGQNGNDGLHYESNVLDTNKDGVVDDEEVKTAQSRLVQLYHLLNSNISSWRRRKIQNEINTLNSALNDDETKTY
jgi:hypothetical protein